LSFGKRRKPRGALRRARYGTVLMCVAKTGPELDIPVIILRFEK